MLQVSWIAGLDKMRDLELALYIELVSTMLGYTQVDTSTFRMQPKNTPLKIAKFGAPGYS